jgi:hypothetical protein
MQRLRLSRSLHLLLPTLAWASCGGPGVRTPNDAGGDRGDTEDGLPPLAASLRINEIVSNDDGTAIDEQGETDDWIELVNTGVAPVDLSAYTLGNGNHEPQALPLGLLEPEQTVLFWADQSPEQGDHHLAFKISSGGEHIILGDQYGRTVDQVVVPALDVNQAWARFADGTGTFARCDYATPGRANGDHCGPPVPPGLPPDLQFTPFTWPDDPPSTEPLAVTRLALFPARFVELRNTSASAINLTDYVARLQPLSPGDPLAGPDVGAALAWPATTLSAGERIVVPIDAAAQGLLEAGNEREGLLTLFRSADGEVIDRVDFMQWPDDAVLMRDTDGSGRLAPTFTFCMPSSTTAALASVDAGACEPLKARTVGDRLHNLRTPGDFAALADGDTELASQSVKFIVDMQAGDTVHFLGTRRWDLHYRFIRERIYHQPALDRCDPLQAGEFRDGWIDFSLREYFKVDRRFLLGTLVRWGGSGLGTIEFAVGDVITGEQMRRAFFAVTRHLPNPRAWAVRPQADDQAQRIRAVDGTLPIVDPNAPFRNQTFQPLVAATGYGVLKFVAGTDIGSTELGPDVVVITDEVPNDIPLLGGLITEAFQTPLAHVAVLSKNRGTPNMALLGARLDPRVAPFLDKLVRFEVSGGDFKIDEATPQEANAFWDQQRPKGPRLAPRRDTTVRDFVELANGTLDDLPVVGAKAAQIAELFHLSQSGVACPGGLPLPRGAFAVPVAHYVEHFMRSGAAAIFAARAANPAFAADPRVRAQALADVRAAITSTPVEPALLQMLRDQIRTRFGSAHVRLRSSSNTEDLPGFTGAGLYTSVSVAVDVSDPKLDVANGLRTVWASLWQLRAYDEREQALVDHGLAAMGVLVEPAFTNERANGVAISRDVLDPIYGDAYYFNAQAGEASVTNPAPGVTSEQGTYQGGIPPRIEYNGHSSLISGTVVTPAELETLMCNLGAIHNHFAARLDPMHLNRWFAMDIEWKLVGPERQLVIKQARPFSFGRADVPTDCREF